MISPKTHLGQHFAQVFILPPTFTFSACKFVPCARNVHRGQKKHQLHWNWSDRRQTLLCGCSGLSLGPLQERQVFLTTESSL